MPDKPTSNTAWQNRVQMYLMSGYGVEDISVMMRCPVEFVRQEVAILRQTGDLAKIYGAAP